MDGYIGIPLDDGQMADDVILLLLLALFVIFAIVFRTNINLFSKMIKDVWQVKERQNLFENISGNEFFYGNFMTFQALFLCTVAIFSLGRLYGYIFYEDFKIAASWFLILFSFIYLLYGVKKGIYYLLGYTFADKEKFKLWKTNYHAIIRTWGIFLYLPVLWLVFIDIKFILPALLFVILYFLCRFVILYQSIRIFLSKSNGFLFIILYLCGLEILPLVMFFQGIVYLYNFIATSAIWH